MTSQELESWIRTYAEVYGLNEHVDEIISWIRPTVALERRHCRDDEIPVAASKAGGQPDAGPGFRWPRTSEGRWMHFVLQINCRDLENSGLGWPDEGLLQIFADDFYSDCEFHIEFHSNTEDLVRVPSSSEQPQPPDEEEYLSTARLRFKPMAMIPADDFAFRQNFDRKKSYEYSSMESDWREELEGTIDHFDDRLGGYPSHTLSGLMWNGLVRMADEHLGVELRNHASLMNNTKAQTREDVLELYGSVELLAQLYWLEGKFIFVTAGWPKDSFCGDSFKSRVLFEYDSY